ncbi:transposase [Roseofilum sp. BLCC_M91]|uniref:Transposase n=1 Tax=Roseofilum halophilum BLCC-M91 TaxID=3022259 RepID=A0ABT7BEG5_9CYAN|nr:hypothetical protein [Roseofilum halophilum]MDJ1177582.1 transposase [Roseofilum halophilum BLCC-M91]
MTDYDSPWKEAISLYFPEFMRFFFPNIATDINWSRGFQFLDTELQKIKRETETGRREADKLVQVWQHNGQETWVLLHIEVQSQPQSEFAERMYIYNSRLFDTYRRQVVSLAVLADERPSWRPHRYKRKLWGCKSSLNFPIVKLLDYNTSELDSNRNPFAAIVQAHRAAQAMGKNPEKGYQNKLRLVKSLYERGLSRKDIVELFRLIDWLMELPEPEERRLWTELETLEKEKVMPYITSVERFGIEKGRAEERQESILRILEVRFVEVPDELKEQVRKIASLEVLAELLTQAVTVESLPSFQTVIDEVATSVQEPDRREE